MTKEYRVKDGKLQLLQKSELEIKTVINVIKYLINNNIIEFRGMSEEVEGITKDQIYQMEAFGLVEFVEEAWHPSWVLSSDAQPTIEMIKREIDLHTLLDNNYED